MNNKLNNYLALAAGITALSPMADAQIIYTDVDPDKVLLYSESFQLDLNNDGKLEYKLIHSEIPFATNHIFGFYGNMIFSAGYGGAGSSWNYFPKPLNLGDDMIASGWDKVWRNGGDLFTMNKKGPVGLWKGLKDKYAGLHFRIDSQFYYGWVRLDIGVDGVTLTIKDYAYNSEVGKSIKAGVTKLSLPDNDSLKHILVYATSGRIKIEAPIDMILNGSIRLSDITGRVLKSVDLKNEKYFELNTQELPGGVYIVNLVTEWGILTKKILIR